MITLEKTYDIRYLMRRTVMGIIFDIQRLSVHDGPGIRTTVFLKGCPLRCGWCHNPESYKGHIQLQYIDEKCIMCGKCLDVCEEGVHVIQEGQHYVDFEQCSLCGRCVDECPSTALNFFGRDLSSKEVIDLVARDESFFEEGGGVTFSGGEVFYQVDFLLALLKESKARGYNTCIDTSGFTSWENFMKVIPYTDSFLYDIKAFDSNTHRLATGVGNELIWENLRKLSELNQVIYIRMPLIKGVNTDLESMTAIAEILGNLRIKGITLMPYHTIGRSKRAQFGMKVGDVYTPPTKEEMTLFNEIFIRCGVQLI